VLAVEPGGALAALAQATLADPRFEVIEGDFEAFESPDLFDIIWAAQSWHWVPADPGFRLARSLLHDHGRLVLVWNWVVGSSIDLQPAYVRHYGDDAGSPPGPIDGAIEEVLQDIEASGHFDAPRVIRVPWSTEIGAEDYAALMDTWSPVRSIAEGKEVFLAHIRELIDAAGGTVRRDFECVAFICEPVR
jgi:SAM-dependent methyltransferase